MSALMRNTINVLSLASRFTPKFHLALPNFHSLSPSNISLVKPGGLFSIVTRNVIRVHFPRPSETKRVKRHGWVKRMSTPAGRRILMNRILKGKFVYSH